MSFAAPNLRQRSQLVDAIHSSARGASQSGLAWPQPSPQVVWRPSGRPLICLRPAPRTSRARTGPCQLMRFGHIKRPAGGAESGGGRARTGSVFDLTYASRPRPPPGAASCLLICRRPERLVSVYGLPGGPPTKAKRRLRRNGSSRGSKIMRPRWRSCATGSLWELLSKPTAQLRAATSNSSSAESPNHSDLASRQPLEAKEGAPGDLCDSRCSLRGPIRPSRRRPMQWAPSRDVPASGHVGRIKRRSTGWGRRWSLEPIWRGRKSGGLELRLARSRVRPQPPAGLRRNPRRRPSPSGCRPGRLLTSLPAPVSRPSAGRARVELDGRGKEFHQFHEMSLRSARLGFMGPGRHLFGSGPRLLSRIECLANHAKN